MLQRLSYSHFSASGSFFILAYRAASKHPVHLSLALAILHTPCCFSLATADWTLDPVAALPHPAVFPGQFSLERKERSMRTRWQEPEQRPGQGPGLKRAKKPALSPAKEPASPPAQKPEPLQAVGSVAPPP